MGLLEKAFEFKKEINRQGKATLIDTIKGPAETEMIDDELTAGTAEGISENIGDDLFDLPEDDDYSPLETLKGQKDKPANIKATWIEEGLHDKRTDKQLPEEPDIPNPLTPDDEPVLPKDIDASLNAVNSIDKNALLSDDENETDDALPEVKETNDIPEVDPYIIADDDNGNSDADLSPSRAELVLPESAESELDEVRDKEEELENKYFSEPIPQVKYKEHMTLYEIGKEISRSETKKVLFEVVIFSVMGQTGTSAASILMLNPEKDKWIIANSSGLKTRDKHLSFDSSAGILKNIKKDIIDTEIFKEDPEFIDSYLELAALPARLLVPWFFKGKVLGILTLGDKITDEEYTDDEKEFIQAICEASALEINKINALEKLKSESENSKTGLDFLQHIHNVQEKILSESNIINIKETVKSEFDRLGIISFSVFIYNAMKDKYIPLITSKDEDYYSGLPVNGTNPFILFIAKNKNRQRIENFSKLEILTEAFNEVQIKKMSVLWIYPFMLGEHLSGFTLITHVKDQLLNEENKKESDNNIEILSTMVLSNTMNILQIDEEENKYSDNIEKVFRKIDRELSNSKKFNIPLSLLIFSIKNYKRYANVFGYKKSIELINEFAELIKKRISETDFSVRYDRNKLLIVLPGKDKHFATTLANTLRNEFMQKFKKNEIQLLITFLISEFPEDGDNLLSLIDNID